ncbi:MAG TPA: hypothetical protein PLQ85_04915 [Anaerolineae bacterium]|nr:hypothetical protein [Anaerolineae bacterium]
MLSLNTPKVFRLIAGLFNKHGIVDVGSAGPSFSAHPGGQPHLPRGQGPARGLIGEHVDLNTLGGKSKSRRDRHRALAAQSKPEVPKAKFKKDRAHRVTVSPLQDDVGAYTLVGRNHLHQLNGKPPRRMWLAGISAQRGF